MLLPKAVYEDRKARMQERTEAVLRFAFDSSHCRAMTILEYFDDKDAAPCGSCDVCRASKPSVAPPIKELKNKVSGMLGLAPSEIVAAFPPGQRQAVVEAIRELSDDQ